MLITRREFLGSAAIITAGAVVGCTASPTPPDKSRRSIAEQEGIDPNDFVPLGLGAEIVFVDSKKIAPSKKLKDFVLPPGDSEVLIIPPDLDPSHEEAFSKMFSGMKALAAGLILWPSLPKDEQIAKFQEHIKKRTEEELRECRKGKKEGFGHRNNFTILALIAVGAAAVAGQHMINGHIDSAFLIPQGFSINNGVPLSQSSVWINLAISQTSMKNQLAILGHSLESMKLGTLVEKDGYSFMRIMWQQNGGMTAHWLTYIRPGIAPIMDTMNGMLQHRFFDARQILKPENVADKIWLSAFLKRLADLLLKRNGSVEKICEGVGTTQPKPMSVLDVEGATRCESNGSRYYVLPNGTVVTLVR